MPQNDSLPRSILREALLSSGYGSEYLEEDWPFLDLVALKAGRSGGSPSSVAIAAFHHERRRDWSTSALVCDLSRPDAVGDRRLGEKHCRFLFESTAAPTIIVANEQTADLWLRCWSPEPHRVSGIGFNPTDLKREFANHREHVERQSLARLRGGQQFLFDSVYDASRDQLAAFLHTGLEQAARKLEEQIPGKSKRAKEERAQWEERISHVAMALLAARIFEDKSFFGNNESQTLDARILLRKAESRSNGFFRRVISDDLKGLDQRFSKTFVDEMLQRVMAHLTGPACFSLITPEMLGDLYERALVANGRRGGKVNLKGIHYTPLSLAKHILRRIPIEELPPSRRHVLDMACGSGSFLLAATSRLRDAFDADEPDAEETVNEHLRSHVFGNDKDDIALLVAKMRYLLTHWIEYGSADDVPMPMMIESDGLELSLKHFGGIAPSVIVGNPPFQPHGSDQMANCFLRKALELLQPGGFLGMIMPASFLKMRRQNAPETRRQLLASCELLEVWEVPEGVVGISSEQATCVIIARKAEFPRTTSTVFKVGYSRRDEAVQAFRDHARSTWTFVSKGSPGQTTSWIEDTEGLNKYRIVGCPIDVFWHRIDLRNTIGKLCEGQSGTGIDPGVEGVFSPNETEGYFPFLQNQGRLFPYSLTREDWYDDPKSHGRFLDPNFGRWPKKKLWHLYSAEKVVVRCDTNRNSRMQIGAAFDEERVFPDHHFRCLGINQSSNIPDWLKPYNKSGSKRSILLWLTAILNSPIAHAWVAMYSPPQGLLEDVLHSIPVPQRFNESIPLLVEATRKVCRPIDFDQNPIWAQWSDRPAHLHGKDFQTLAGQINRLLFESYGLGKCEFDEVGKYLEGMTDPWVAGSATAHHLQHSIRCITGTVVSINVSEQSICLDLPRYSRRTGRPIEVILPSDMPGWALREGIGFTCSVPKELTDRDELRSNPWLLRDFRSLPYSYLSPQQLRELVASRSMTEMAEG